MLSCPFLQKDVSKILTRDAQNLLRPKSELAFAWRAPVHLPHVLWSLRGQHKIPKVLHSLLLTQKKQVGKLQHEFAGSYWNGSPGSQTYVLVKMYPCDFFTKVIFSFLRLGKKDTKSLWRLKYGCGCPKREFLEKDPKLGFTFREFVTRVHSTTKQTTSPLHDHRKTKHTTSSMPPANNMLWD